MIAGGLNSSEHSLRERGLILAGVKERGVPAFEARRDSNLLPEGCWSRSWTGNEVMMELMALPTTGGPSSAGIDVTEDNRHICSQRWHGNRSYQALLTDQSDHTAEALGALHKEGISVVISLETAVPPLKLHKMLGTTQVRRAARR